MMQQFKVYTGECLLGSFNTQKEAKEFAKKCEGPIVTPIIVVKEMNRFFHNDTSWK